MVYQKITVSDALIRNRADWDKMPIRNMHADTNLITCCQRFFLNRKNKTLLDIGFGEGQNLRYFASEGFDCYGTEISRRRMRAARSNMKRYNLPVRLKFVSSYKLPFVDNFFDVVVAWQSIYYNDREGLQRVLAEIYRVLKPGGQFLSSMLSVKHDNLCGQEIAPSVFKPRIKSQSHCITFGFKNTRQIRSIYKQFSDIKIGFYSSRMFEDLSFHYVILCEKER